jgi:CheY-like chemotaxis protein
VPPRGCCFGRRALADTRRLLSVLRADDDAAARAPQPGIEEITDLVGHTAAAGLAATLTVRGDPVPVPAGLALSAYRIVQEAIRRHPDVVVMDVRMPGMGRDRGHPGDPRGRPTFARLDPYDLRPG